MAILDCGLATNDWLRTRGSWSFRPEAVYRLDHFDVRKPTVTGAERERFDDAGDEPVQARPATATVDCIPVPTKRAAITIHCAITKPWAGRLLGRSHVG